MVHCCLFVCLFVCLLLLLLLTPRPGKRAGSRGAQRSMGGAISGGEGERQTDRRTTAEAEAAGGGRSRATGFSVSERERRTTSVIANKLEIAAHVGAWSGGGGKRASEGARNVSIPGKMVDHHFHFGFCFNIIPPVPNTWSLACRIDPECNTILQIHSCNTIVQGRAGRQDAMETRGGAARPPLPTSSPPNKGWGWG